MVINQYEIYLVALDPVVGHEIKKTRPCVVISPNELNHNIMTVIIAPMTTRSPEYPTRVRLVFHNKAGFIVLDQLKTVDRSRLIKKLGTLEKKTVSKVKQILKEMLID